MLTSNSLRSLSVAVLTALLLAAYFFTAPSPESDGDDVAPVVGTEDNANSEAPALSGIDRKSKPAAARILSTRPEPVRSDAGWGKRFFEAHQDAQPDDALAFDLHDDLRAAGVATMTASTVPFGPNVNLVLGLYDSTGTALVTDDPTGTRNASVSFNALPAGTYTVRISAAGEGDLVTGYSAYAPHDACRHKPLRTGLSD